LLLDNTDMVQEQLLKVICVSRGLTTSWLGVDLMEFRLHQLLGELFFFLNQAAKILKLGLPARHLVSPEVIVDLPRKNFITKTKLSHL
jgi:hypothetical protein